MMIHNSYDFADENSVVKLVPSGAEAYMSIAPGNLNWFISNDFPFIHFPKLSLIQSPPTRRKMCSTCRRTFAIVCSRTSGKWMWCNATRTLIAWRSVEVRSSTSSVAAFRSRCPTTALTPSAKSAHWNAFAPTRSATRDRCFSSTTTRRKIRGTSGGSADACRTVPSTRTRRKLPPGCWTESFPSTRWASSRTRI